ncbi:MAG: DUF4258 domain-containing protein [Xanthobacteraceae bacterium]
MSKRLILTAHAQIRLRERHLDPTWVEDAARNPDWVEPEPRDVRLRRHFRVIPQAGARTLRVVCAEETTIRVVSAMFDRKARRKP